MKKLTLLEYIVVIILVAVMATSAFGTALTEDRSSPARDGYSLAIGAAVANTIYAGAMVAVDANGYAVPASTSTAITVIGRAEAQVDNSSGANGDETVIVGTGIYRFANSSAGDAISDNDIGKIAYAVDDQTVALTDGSGTRVPAGMIYDVGSNGVWVDFSHARALGSGIATGEVTTGHILNGTITAADLAALAVSTAKLAADAVDGTKMADDAVSLEHLDSGIAPGFITVVCNTTTAENDADAQVVETHASILATDTIVASIHNATASVFINGVTPGSGSCTFDLSGNGGVGTEIDYCAQRAAQ